MPHIRRRGEGGGRRLARARVQRLLQHRQVARLVGLDRIARLHGAAAGVAEAAAKGRVPDQAPERLLPFPGAVGQQSVVPLVHDLEVGAHPLGHRGDGETHVLERLETALPQHPLLVGEGVDAHVDGRKVRHLALPPPRQGLHVGAGDAEARIADDPHSNPFLLLQLPQHAVQGVEVGRRAVAPRPSHHHPPGPDPVGAGPVGVGVDGGGDVGDDGVAGAGQRRQVLGAHHHVAGHGHELGDLPRASQPAHERVGGGAVGEVDQVVHVVDEGRARPDDAPLQEGRPQGHGLQVEVDQVCVQRRLQVGPPATQPPEERGGLGHAVAGPVQDAPRVLVPEGAHVHVEAGPAPARVVLLEFEPLAGGAPLGVGAEDDDAAPPPAHRGPRGTARPYSSS